MYSQLETFIKKIVTGFILGECILKFHFCRKLQNKKIIKKITAKEKTCASMEVFFIFAKGV